MSDEKYTSGTQRGHFAPQYVYPSVEATRGYLIGSDIPNNPQAEKHAKAMKAVFEAALAWGKHAEARHYPTSTRCVDGQTASPGKHAKACDRLEAALKRLAKLEEKP